MEIRRTYLAMSAIAICACLFSGTAWANDTANPDSGRNPFLILADVSGSMQETVSFKDKSGHRIETSKAQLAKQLLRDIYAQLTPVCETGVYRFWLRAGSNEYYRPFADIGNHTQAEITDRISDAFDTDFPKFDRLTFLGGTLRQLDKNLLQNVHGQMTVLLVSDGEEYLYDLEADARGGESEELSNPIVELRRIKKKYGKRFILHTLFVGGERRKKREFAGEPLLEKMAGIGSGRHFDGRELYGNSEKTGELCALACNETLDSDNDGVPDGFDKCPGTPEWVCADDEGCPGCRGKKDFRDLREAKEKLDDAVPTALDDFQPGPPLDLNCAETSGEASDFLSEIQNGEDFYNAGDFDSASAAWERALYHHDARADLCKYTETLVRLTASYQAVGKHRLAIKAIEAGIPVIEKSDDPNLLVLAWSTMADIRLALGQADKSAMCQEKVFELIDMVNSRRVYANILLNAANSLAADGDYETSMAYYRIILGYYEDSINAGLEDEIDPTQRSKVLNNVIRLKHQAKDYSEIEMLLEMAFQRLIIQPNSVDKSADLISFAVLCADIRDNLEQPVKDDEGPREPVKFVIEDSLEAGVKVNIDIPEGYTLKEIAECHYTVYFELGEYVLSKTAKSILDEAVVFINVPNNATHIHVKGCTDALPVGKNRKDYTSNLELSAKRVESVAQYLKTHMAERFETSESGGKTWKFGLKTGEFPDKGAAMKEARRLKTAYRVKTAVIDTIRSSKKRHAVYAGEFDSEKAASEFSMQIFQKRYPVKKTRMIQTSETRSEKERIVILKEAVGRFEPEVENNASLFGTPENRRVEIAIILLDSVDDKVRIDLDKIGTSGRYYEKVEKAFPLDTLRQEILYQKSLYAYLTELSLLSLKEAGQVVDSLDIDRLTPAVFGHMSRLYKAEQYDERAMNLTRRAVSEAERRDVPEALYRWQWQLGREYKDAGEIEKAVAEYRKAIATLNPIRYKFFQGYRVRKNIFKERVKPVYLELADLLLKQAEGLPEGEARQKKLREARDVVETMKASELENFFRDECVTRKEDITDVPDNAPPHTAIIHSIVLPEKMALLLTLPDGMRLVEVPFGEKDLERTVARFRKRLQNRMNNRFIHDAEQLYDWIVRPIETELISRNIHTLSFAPDGALRMVPMSTLFDGQSFLVEKYAISVIPFMKLIDFDPIPVKRHRILLSGVSEARQEFSALPSVPRELADIKEIMDGETVLLNEAMVYGRLEKEIRGKYHTIFHIATHGVFGGTPEESFLLEYDGRLNMNKLEKLVETGISFDLLTLSACQTALGNERAALGLAGVAVKSGVKSALATLWYVDDEATSLAIREFYRQLKTGAGKAGALQLTQKKMIGRPRYWHPLYWAPFVLIGNWM